MIKKIGIALNPTKEDALELTSSIIQYLIGKGCSIVLEKQAASLVGYSEFSGTAEDVAKTDMVLVLGGDGTMLRWGRITSPHSTPLIGINFGQYGFITEIEPKDSFIAIDHILSGNYSISERILLKASISRHDGSNSVHYALNDIVVSKGPLARMLSLDTYISKKFIVTYAADGIIVSSPTGSTAYSLAAGGPVVHPDVKVLIITPICPHTLNERSLVVPDSEIIEIVSESAEAENNIILTVDGQLGEHISNKDRVAVEKAEFTAKLIQIEDKSFYSKLQSRLHWGER